MLTWSPCPPPGTGPGRCASSVRSKSNVMSSIDARGLRQSWAQQMVIRSRKKKLITLCRGCQAALLPQWFGDKFHRE
jgi:hypothetical protein